MSHGGSINLFSIDLFQILKTTFQTNIDFVMVDAEKNKKNFLKIFFLSGF